MIYYFKIYLEVLIQFLAIVLKFVFATLFIAGAMEENAVLMIAGLFTVPLVFVVNAFLEKRYKVR